MDRELGFRAGTIWSFERVSAALQQHGRGLKRQGSRAQEWCDRHGLELADSRSLSDPGKSAFHGKHLRRGGPLDVFMELAERELLGPDPVLLVEAVDRLSRLKTREALQSVFLRLINAGVTIVTLMDGQFYNREKVDADGTALVMLTLKCQAAHEYSLQLADRQRDNWQEVRNQLRDGRVLRTRQNAPKWVSFDSERNAFVLNEKAESVRRAFELLRNHGYSKVARMLNDEGYPALRSERWTASTLSVMVRGSHQVYGAVAVRPPGSWKPLERGPLGELQKANGTFYDARAQKGLVRGGKNEPLEIIEGVFPPVLPRSEVEAVRALIAKRDRTRNRPGPNVEMHWIGRGLTRCVCGASMSTCLGGHPPRKLIRYIACRERNSSERCRRPFLPMQDILAVLLSRLTVSNLAQLSGEVDVVSATARIRRQIETLLADQAARESEIDSIKESLGKAAEAGGPAFETVYQMLSERIASKQRELEAISEELAMHRAELSRHDNPLALETVETVIEPLKRSLLDGSSTREQRYQANIALQQLGLVITIDSAKMLMGLSIGGSKPQMQPIDFEAAYEALELGKSGVTYIAPAADALSVIG